MRFQDFRTCLSSLEPTGTYLLWGNEAFLIDAILSKLIDLLFGKTEARRTNCVVLYAADCRASEAVAAASTLPFFGQKSLVVVHDISEFQKSDIEVIHDYLLKQTPAAVFVLTDTTRPPYPMPQHPAIPKGKARVVEVSSPPDWDFDKWVDFLLSREKKRISRDALESLRENVGNDITNLAMEIEKLVCMAGDQPEITESHTEALLGRSRAETEFALADAVASGDRTRALTIFSDLMREGSRIPRMTALIRSQLEKIWQAKEMLREGRQGEEVCRELRVFGKRMPEFLSTVSRFQTEDLRRALRLILDADLRARTVRLDERTIMETLLLALCGQPQ
jgi:DNA polymerase-3 subunit delta